LGISGGVVLIIALLLASGRGESLTVKKAPEVKLKATNSVYVRVSCANTDSPNPSLKPAGYGYLEDELANGLKSLGISPSVDEAKCEYIVHCSYRNDWATPHIGRHWDVFVTSIYWVNIKLIDRKTKLVIGEVEYKRPRLKTRPPEGFIETMLKELVTPTNQPPKQ